MKTLSVLIMSTFLAVSCSHMSGKDCKDGSCEKKTTESCCKDGKCSKKDKADCCKEDGSCEKKKS